MTLSNGDLAELAALQVSKETCHVELHLSVKISRNCVEYLLAQLVRKEDLHYYKQPHFVIKRNCSEIEFVSSQVKIEFLRENKEQHLSLFCTF